MEFKEGQKVTRLELTKLLCKEEIESGLITEEKPLMQASIIDARFRAYTNLEFKVVWTDELCKNGLVEKMYLNDNSSYNHIEEIDTSEYNDC